MHHNSTVAIQTTQPNSGWFQLAMQFSTPTLTAVHRRPLADIQLNTPALVESTNDARTVAAEAEQAEHCPECGGDDVNRWQSQQICARCLHEWRIEVRS